MKRREKVVVGRYSPVNYLFELIVLIGIAVLVYAIGYPIYVATKGDPAKQSPPTKNEQSSEEFFSNEQLYRSQRAEPKQPEKGKAIDVKSQSQGIEQAEEYEAPIQTPLRYLPKEPAAQVELEEEIEEEAIEVEERVQEEVPLEFIEMSRRRDLNRPLQTIELDEAPSEVLDPKDAIEFARREKGRLQTLEQEAASQEQQGSAEQEVQEPRINPKDRRYIEKGWQKFTAHKGGFTIWVPNELYYIASTDPGRTEVYQSDANGIYYGLQRRRLERTYSGYGDTQMKAIFQKAYEEWQENFAAGVPGLRQISKAFTRDGDTPRIDIFMGAETGQIRLRIFTTENYMFWLWTVYLHDMKSQADHRMYINGIEVQKP